MDVSQHELQQAAQGDPVALDVVFSQVEPFVRNFIRTHIADPNDADDVIQECLVDILEQIQKGVQIHESFEDWVAGIIWRKLARYWETGWECGDPRRNRIEAVSLDTLEDGLW